MKRIFWIFLSIMLFVVSPLFADLDYTPDDHSYVDVRYGYWYTKWLPSQSSIYSYEPFFKNKIDAAMLNEVSASVTLGGTTDFLAQYISDQIMKKVNTGMEQDLSKKDKKMVDMIMGQIKQRLYSELYITGRYTMGRFRGDMKAIRYFDYNGKLYTPGEATTWYSDFSTYDIFLNVGRPRYMRPGMHDMPWIGAFGLGVRRTEYSFPMQYALKYGEFNANTVTAISPTKFIGYNPCIFVDVEKSVVDYGDSRQSITVGGLLTMGFPKLKNENINQRGMNMMEEAQLAYNFAILKNDYVVFRFYFGFKFMNNGYAVFGNKNHLVKKDVNAYDSSGNITYTVRKGDRVDYGGNYLNDIFAGPIFGFEMIF